MSLICRIKGHESAPHPVWNGSRSVTPCQRCGALLVRGNRGVWKIAPAGTPTEAKPPPLID